MDGQFRGGLGQDRSPATNRSLPIPIMGASEEVAWLPVGSRPQHWGRLGDSSERGFARVSVSPSSRACLTVEASAAIQISLETEWVPSGEPLEGEAWTRIVPRSGGGEKSLSKTNFILKF